METVGDVDQGGENHICREESLGQGDATNGRVIQSTLKPLVRMRVGGILCTNEKENMVASQYSLRKLGGESNVLHRIRTELMHAQ